MGVQIQFNYENWIMLFPEFQYLSEPQAQMYFDLATNYVRNDGCGPVENATQQTNLLNLVTAHLAKLFAPTKTGQASSDLVGRISSASEGSDSVSADMPSSPGAAWWNQTRYGAAYWQAILPFRTMRYRVGRQRLFQPWPWQ